MNLSPANKNLFAISFILCLCNKRVPTKGVLPKFNLITRLVKNLLDFFSLINLTFLVFHTAHFDKIISFPLIFFATPVFLPSFFSIHFKQYGNIVIKIY